MHPVEKLQTFKFRIHCLLGLPATSLKTADHGKTTANVPSAVTSCEDLYLSFSFCFTFPAWSRSNCPPNVTATGSSHTGITLPGRRHQGSGRSESHDPSRPSLLHHMFTQPLRSSDPTLRHPHRFGELTDTSAMSTERLRRY